MTDRLYYADPYLTSFTARVVERLELDSRPAVILDRTAFYPTGGGQPSDRGRLNQVEVVDVVAREDDLQTVLHLLSGTLRDDEVAGAVDWPRRFDLMQQHTGQHILSQAFVQAAGAETVAFHLNDDRHEGSVTIDLNRSGLLPTQIDQAEDLANQIVYENRPVMARFVSEAELVSIPLRKPPAVNTAIRIVEIEDFDWSACGGTHVARAGEVGQIKIIKIDRRGAETRVEFRCGRRALIDYRRKNEMINRVAADLSIGNWELDQTAARLVEDNKALHKQLQEAQGRLLESEARELLSNLRVREGCAVALRVWHDLSMADLRQVAKQIIARPKTVALLGSDGERPALVFARSGDLAFDMNALVRGAAARIGGKGGG
ncbi:MAG: alanyl-tRNA editing protein [Anaerolineae bacterium]